MDLCRDSVNTLTPEWIHQEIDWKLEHWIRAGRLLGTTERAVPADLRRTRSRHRTLIKQTFGEETVKQWQ
jgi:hypothetical protein